MAFREKELWTREVNLTLDCNKRAILRLYDCLAMSKNRRLTFEEAVKLMTVQSKLIRLSVEDAHACYARSQQTCVDLVLQSQLSCS